jgi:hypothetical protein
MGQFLLCMFATSVSYISVSTNTFISTPVQMYKLHILGLSTNDSIMNNMVQKVLNLQVSKF